MFPTKAQRIAQLVRQIEQGWDETIEWRDTAGSAHCRKVWQRGLLTQLRHEVAQPLAIANSENKNANKSESKSPGNTAALNVIERCEGIFKLARSVMGEYVENDAIQIMASDFEESFAPDIDIYLDSLISDLRHVVKSARIILGYDSPKKVLADSRCEDCGGTLVAAEDATSDVLCVGTDAARGCGRRYRRQEWVLLLAAIAGRVDTAAACLYAGRSVPTLYRWAAEGRVRRHRGLGRRSAEWDLSELPPAVEGQPLPPPPPVRYQPRTRAVPRTTEQRKGDA